MRTSPDPTTQRPPAGDRRPEQKDIAGRRRHQGYHGRCIRNDLDATVALLPRGVLRPVPVEVPRGGGAMSGAEIVSMSTDEQARLAELVAVVDTALTAVLDAVGIVPPLWTGSSSGGCGR